VTTLFEVFRWGILFEMLPSQHRYRIKCGMTICFLFFWMGDFVLDGAENQTGFAFA